MIEDTHFGKQLRQKSFPHHIDSILRLNNGSFGSCPKIVLETQNKIRNHWLTNPDDFWLNELNRAYKDNCKAIANRLIGTKEEDTVVLVDNLTTAMAILAHNIVSTISKPRAVILLNKFTYSAVKAAMDYACSIASSHFENPDEATSVEMVDLPFPVVQSPTPSDIDDVIVEAYKSALHNLVTVEGRHIAVAIIDHICSLPCVRLPVERLIVLCREYGVDQIIIDGAHAPGQLPMSKIPELGCDYYVANLHKWCFAPTSAAFMWISPSALARNNGFHHPIISHNYGKGFVEECAMQGTKDYSAMLSVSAALDFIDSLGGIAAVAKRNNDLCVKTMKVLSDSWIAVDREQGENVTAEFDDATYSPLAAATSGLSMGMVGLPRILGDTWEDSSSLKSELASRSGIVVQYFYPVAGDRLYLRVSAAVYNYMDEYYTLRDEITAIARTKAASNNN